MCKYSHKFPSVHSICSSSGFLEATHTDQKLCDKTGKECKVKKVTAWAHDMLDFQYLGVEYGAPTTTASHGQPYFQSSKELINMLQRYTKYKLIAVKQFIKDFRFLEITITSKSKDITDEDRKLITDYMDKRFDDTTLDDMPVVPMEKFDVTYQYKNSGKMQLLRRNHTTTADDKFDYGDLTVGGGDQFGKTYTVTSKSVLKQHYYPRFKCYLDSNLFFQNTFDGNFKKWMDKGLVTGFPNMLYGRNLLGPEQWVSKDPNVSIYHVTYYNVYVYYVFKFVGINNLDIQ